MGKSDIRIRKELLEAREKMRLDEETFTFILYWCGNTGFVEEITESRFKPIMAALDGFGLNRGAALDPYLKQGIRELAVEELQKEILGRGLPLERTANDLSKDVFGISNYLWCTIDQLGALLYCLRNKTEDWQP